MNFIGQVISDFKIEMIIGLLLIILGIIIPTFKLYWLIAGVNTASKKELGNIDLKYLSKYIGIFFGGLGLLLILNPLIFSYFNLKSSLLYIQPITIFSVVIFYLVFYNIKQDRINKRDIKK